MRRVATAAALMPALIILFAPAARSQGEIKVDESLIRIDKDPEQVEIEREERAGQLGPGPGDEEGAADGVWASRHARRRGEDGREANANSDPMMQPCFDDDDDCGPPPEAASHKKIRRRASRKVRTVRGGPRRAIRKRAGPAKNARRKKPQLRRLRKRGGATAAKAAAQVDSLVDMDSEQLTVDHQHNFEGGGGDGDESAGTPDDGGSSGTRPARELQSSLRGTSPAQEGGDGEETSVGPDDSSGDPNLDEDREEAHKYMQMLKLSRGKGSRAGAGSGGSLGDGAPSAEDIAAMSNEIMR